MFDKTVFSLAKIGGSFSGCFRQQYFILKEANLTIIGRAERLFNEERIYGKACRQRIFSTSGSMDRKERIDAILAFLLHNSIR